jgi:hypothetical protein
MQKRVSETLVMLSSARIIKISIKKIAFPNYSSYSLGLIWSRTHHLVFFEEKLKNR